MGSSESKSESADPTLLAVRRPNSNGYANLGGRSVMEDLYELELIEARDELEARAVFNKYSADGLTIEPSSLRVMLKQYCAEHEGSKGHCVDEQDIIPLITVLDTTGSERISFEDFFRAYTFFERLDLTGAGRHKPLHRITARELLSGLRSAGLHPTAQQLEVLLHSINHRQLSAAHPAPPANPTAAAAGDATASTSTDLVTTNGVESASTDVVPATPPPKLKKPTGHAYGAQAADAVLPGSPRDEHAVSFMEFWRLLSRNQNLQFAYQQNDPHLFQSNWNTVYRPGLLKTPIFKTRHLTPIEDFVCGSLSGVITTIVGHPFDTIKVRMQTDCQPGVTKQFWSHPTITGVTPATAAVSEAAGVASHSTAAPVTTNSARVDRPNAFRVLADTVRKEGPVAVFKGMSSPMMSIPLVNAIVFGSYNQAKLMIKRWTEAKYGNTELTLNQLAICGAWAGLLSCFVVSPAELIRSRLQVQTIAGTGYTGPFDCSRAIVRTNGWRGLFRGLMPTIYRDVPAYMVQFYVYEALKERFTPKKPVAPHPGRPVPAASPAEVPIGGLLLSGGLAGVAAWIVTYPIDVLKSKIQVSEAGGAEVYKKHRYIPDGGLIDGWKRTVKSEGVRGLFRGIGPCLGRAFPVNASAFWVYEYMSKFIKENINAPSY